MLHSSDSLIRSAFTNVLGRVLPGHGFSDRPDGSFRPDATAWAMMVLKNQELKSEIVKAAGDRLLDVQMPDGRVVISKGHLDAYWPTPLSILAWDGSSAHQSALEHATTFLLKTTGVHWEKTNQDVVGHDTLIPGWPWVDSTHSWVAPTALSMIALTVSGFGDHERVKAGARLLVDRQIPSGGWNYGNTSVLGKKLRPFPETTGVALNALVGHVQREAIEPSIEYLLQHISTYRTPLSLGWSILGLKAWNAVPAKAHEWIIETFERGHLYGGYDTASLCVLLAAALASSGLESVVTTRPHGTKSS
ncbi:MAG: prenyltransferase/squalene oxidase repeat-containing protein [Nitrospirales bacterium]